MLFISGSKARIVNPHLGDVFQSRNRDAFHFRRITSCLLVPTSGFNLAIEMLVISGARVGGAREAVLDVSISQSRCLSFQGKDMLMMQRALFRFNLAIEMLVISGRIKQLLQPIRYQRFNLAIEMLVISGKELPVRLGSLFGLFQSRNRDACHFRFYADMH